MTEDSRKHEADRKKYEHRLKLAASVEQRDQARRQYDTDLHRLARQTKDMSWREFIETRRRFIKSQMGL